MNDRGAFYQKSASFRTIDMRSKIFLHSILVLIFFISFWLVWSGLDNGKKHARDSQVVLNTQELVKAINYFYDDQERLPTSREFSVSGLFSSYLTLKTNWDMPMKKCDKTFDYIYNGPKSASLSFCLVAGYKNYGSGWNTIRIQK